MVAKPRMSPSAAPRLDRINQSISWGERRVGQILDDHGIVAAVAAKVRELGDRLMSARFGAYAQMAGGWLAMQEEDMEGVAMFRQGCATMTACHDLTYAPYSAQQRPPACCDLATSSRPAP